MMSKDYGEDMWKTFVEEASSFGQTDNPVIRINICRRCGATDNLHDPHIPSQFKHSVDADSCSRCDSFGAENLSFKEQVEKMFDFSHPQKAVGTKKYTQREAGLRGRRREYEQMGVLPKAKSYRVETPKWFKVAQMGVIAGIAGLISYSGFKGKE
jgi:hypothetical protein